VNGTDDLNWPDNTEPEAVREIVRLAERMMADNLAMALAADQRAVGQGNMMVAVAAALLVAAATLSGVAEHDPLGVRLLVLSAVGFVIAAGISMHAARPVHFFSGGYQPKFLTHCAADADRIDRWVAEDLQSRITHNRRALTDSAGITRWAQRAMIGSIIVPAALYGFMQLPG